MSQSYYEGKGKCFVCGFPTASPMQTICSDCKDTYVYRPTPESKLIKVKLDIVNLLLSIIEAEEERKQS